LAGLRSDAVTRLQLVKFPSRSSMIVAVFSYTFGAIVLLMKKGVTDNTLSVSVLSATIMFNPKKLGIYNEMVLFG
jgi:hypothetical protein